MRLRSWRFQVAVSVFCLALLGLPSAKALAGGRATAKRASVVATKKAKKAKKPVATPSLENSQAQSRRVKGRGFRLVSTLERAKFRRVNRFAKHGHARMQKHVTARLKQPKADLSTATAAIIRLMDTGYLRVGGERFAQRDDTPSYGAATLRKKNVEIEGDRIVLTFRGKSGVPWRKTLEDPLLARALEVFMKLPGERLFQVPGPNGKMTKVTAEHVRVALEPFGAKPKDLRTLHANRIFDETLAHLPKPKNDKQVERNIEIARGEAAFALRHRASTSNKSYLDPRHAALYRRHSAGSSHGAPLHEDSTTKTK